MARMIGPSCHFGPGGRGCSCCNWAPGKARRGARRTAKRSERQKVKQFIQKEW